MEGFSLALMELRLTSVFSRSECAPGRNLVSMKMTLTSLFQQQPNYHCGTYVRFGSRYPASGSAFNCEAEVIVLLIYNPNPVFQVWLDVLTPPQYTKSLPKTMVGFRSSISDVYLIRG